MRVETLTINDPRWMAALGRLRHDFYHLPSYVRLDAQRMNATPEALLVSDNERLFFIPYLVRSCNPLFPEMQEPVSDAVSPYGYPGILISDTGRDVSFAAEGFAALRETLAERGVCSAFLRMHPILGNDFTTFFPPGVFTDSSETVAIDLELDESTLQNQIRTNCLKNIKKCVKLCYVARFLSLTEVLDDFVDIYNQTMDRVRAKDSYYFSREYFERIAQLPGVHCCIVNSGPTIVAAAVFFECNGIIQFHLGGTLTEFLSTSPFNLILYDTIHWAKRRGNRWLHLGGGVGGGNDSLLRFKAGFSPTRFHFLTTRLIINEVKYSQLVALKAQAAKLTPETAFASNFFPAYRS